MNRLALAALIVAAAGAPALAQETMPVERERMMPETQQSQPMQQQQQTSSTVTTSDAFDTQVPPLTYTVAEDRMAAITYMDDALKLIELGEAAIQTGDMMQARSALMGASGKLTNAYLLNFRDRQFSQQIQPLTMRIQDAVATMDTNSSTTLSSLSDLRSQVASIAETQLATMGGGGGGMAGFETIEIIGEEEITEPVTPNNEGLDELNVPNEQELD
jgi:hypothetical protein